MPLLMQLDPRRLTHEQRIAGAILFFGYLLGAQIGAHFFTAPAVLSPAPGIALAGLVLGGIALWPAVFLAAVVNAFLTSSSVTATAIIPVAQTLQAIAGAIILSQLEFDPVLRRLRDMLSLMAVALIVSAIVPTLGFFGFFLSELLNIPYTTSVSWGSWWTGHILSLLVISPLLIRWIAKPQWHRTPSQILEIICAFGALGTVILLMAFGTNQLAGLSLIYILLVPLMWISIRLGSRLTILAIFLMTVGFMAALFYGPIAPEAAELGQRLFQVQVLIIILTVIFYIITGLQEERNAAIKELKSYISQLERALNQLSLQDRAKSDFVAILAHELRNPLAPVVSTLELMRLNLEHTEESLEALNHMDDHLKTIQRLLDDLLDVSRISKAKLQLKKESVELRGIVDRSIQSIERYLKNRNQTLVLDLAREPLILEADPVRIEQIINNLLSNASKYTPEGGRISITTKRDGDTAIIRVIDSGIGIHPQMLNRIFEPFLQLEAAVRPQEGLGIGLSLTQRLVEMHGGKIEAYSEGEGKGSQFIVRLPLLPTFSPAPSEAKERAFSSPFPQASSSSKVLVVDDNAAAAKGIGALLEHKGYIVAYAYSGTQAKEKMEEFAPDAVVLDIGLPDMSGYDVARAMRKEHGYAGKLIALTGYGQEEDKQRAIDVGFDHHLTKPIAIADLHELLVRA